MASAKAGRAGILPAGALGVSFFYHLTQRVRKIDGDVYFLERAGSASAKALRQRGEISIADEEGLHRVPTAGILKPDLLACYEENSLPDVLLVCPNPDQLTGVMGNLVELLEHIHQKRRLDTAALPFPLVMLCSNGIYYQRLRSWFVEKLEESVLFGRLPELWPDLMAVIVGRLLRGVTLQTGVRDGSGATTVYRPGPPAVTYVSGGNEAIRRRCCRILQKHGGRFEQTVHGSATRLEFDKAMLNLATNSLGQLYAIDDRGRFAALAIGDMIGPERRAAIRELFWHVFQTGLALKVYGAEESFEDIYAQRMENLRLHETHVPSSLQWVALRYRQGALEPKLSPTEAWLLDPLVRFARGAGLDDAAHYFEDLKKRLLRKLELAADACRNRDGRTAR